MSSPDPEAPAERPEADDAAPEASQRESVRKALLGYRVMAWTTGIWLIALCYEMVLKYIVKVEDPPSWIGIVHGWVYFVYLL
ncbi:MAG: rane protein, partial [Mycobacterium sp.]|nr:rane protein [Mycobacterium sp.]